MVDILWGAVNPSGRLPYTIAKQASDYGSDIGSGSTVTYSEGLNIDYRWFDKVSRCFSSGSKLQLNGLRSCLRTILLLASNLGLGSAIRISRIQGFLSGPLLQLAVPLLRALGRRSAPGEILLALAVMHLPIRRCFKQVTG